MCAVHARRKDCNDVDETNASQLANTCGEPNNERKGPFGSWSSRTSATFTVELTYAVIFDGKGLFVSLHSSLSSPFQNPEKPNSKESRKDGHTHRKKSKPPLPVARSHQSRFVKNKRHSRTHTHQKRKKGMPIPTPPSLLILFFPN